MKNDAKSSTISRVCRCCCNFFFDEILDDFFFGEERLLPKENQRPIWGSHGFCKEKLYVTKADCRQTVVQVARAVTGGTAP